jgi:hypothetical protein
LEYRTVGLNPAGPGPISGPQEPTSFYSSCHPHKRAWSPVAPTVSILPYHLTTSSEEPKKKSKKSKSKKSKKQKRDRSSSATSSTSSAKHKKSKKQKVASSSSDEDKADLGRFYAGKYYKAAKLPSQSTTYQNLPILAAMEALHIIDAAKCPEKDIRGSLLIKGFPAYLNQHRHQLLVSFYP